MADIKTLIGQNKYDCLAWVPTIRGSLSLDIVEDAKYILGDVDKYVVAFSNYVGLQSQHYVAATALLTFNDSKYGPDYVRTFRYFFYGQVDSEEEEHNVLKGKFLLMGKEDFGLSVDEARLLELFEDLTKLKKEYDKKMKLEAASMKDLADIRNSMKDKWNVIKRIIDYRFDNTLYPCLYCFDVALFRDGILLLNLRNKSSIIDTNLADDENDFTKHLPIHRVFKVAMNIIKFIFHTNYHHYADHDTLLPASNLHPWMKGNCDYYSQIFRHQLDSLLTPITRIKRKGFNEYTINPQGIFQYAKSLINVFGKNELIKPDEERWASLFLEAQRQEYDAMTEISRVKRNEDIESSSPWKFFYNSITILGIYIAVLEYADKKFAYTIPIGNMQIPLIVIFLISFLGLFLLLRYWVKRFWLSKGFIVKGEDISLISRYFNKISNLKYKLLYRNSNLGNKRFCNLENKRFSFQYQIWIVSHDLKRYKAIKGLANFQILSVLFYSFALGTVVYAIYNLWPIILAYIILYYKVLSIVY